MLAAKWFDPVLGLDIHIVLVPTPAGPVPTPIPMPFVGMIWDPAGAVFGQVFSMVMSGGPSATLVNGLPVVTSGICGYATHVTTADAGIVIPEPFRRLSSSFS